MRIGISASAVQMRLWPGVTAALMLVAIRFLLPVVFPDAMAGAFIASVALSIVIFFWWLFFSRAPMVERWGTLVFLLLAFSLAKPLVHPSIDNGMMGMMFYAYALVLSSLALVAGAWVGRSLKTWPRWIALGTPTLFSSALMLLLRTDGITGGGQSQFAFRWQQTSEQQLLMTAPKLPPPAPPAPIAAVVEAAPAEQPKRISKPVVAEWPGFRGPLRNDTVAGYKIATDWKASPPIELWRSPIGPGWSSFALNGSLLYTMEQRGESEIVSCYSASTGKPVWSHSDNARFWESNAGPGPRSTPFIHNGAVFTFGATGILNALDAATGTLLWTRNAAADAAAKTPGWGFASSPLAIEDTVYVAASGKLAAYNAQSGEPRWVVDAGGSSYSSPHVATIGGVQQIVVMTGSGATSVAPSSGKVLWKHSWEGAAILQPALLEDGGMLVTTADMAGGAGTRRLSVKQSSGAWNAEELWTSNGLKPYYNDLVVHRGFAYGFDGGILSCIDLADGKRKWKGGRYGHGQLLLLKDQDLLLVLTEEGEIALAKAEPDQFTELARMPALNDKTWNHPILAGGILYIRNGQEMAAYRLPPLQ